MFVCRRKPFVPIFKSYIKTRTWVTFTTKPGKRLHPPNTHTHTTRNSYKRASVILASHYTTFMCLYVEESLSFPASIATSKHQHGFNSRRGRASAPNIHISENEHQETKGNSVNIRQSSSTVQQSQQQASGENKKAEEPLLNPCQPRAHGAHQNPNSQSKICHGGALGSRRSAENKRSPSELSASLRLRERSDTHCKQNRSSASGGNTHAEERRPSPRRGTYQGPHSQPRSHVSGATPSQSEHRNTWHEFMQRHVEAANGDNAPCELSCLQSLCECDARVQDQLKNIASHVASTVTGVADRVWNFFK